MTYCDLLKIKYTEVGMTQLVSFSCSAKPWPQTRGKCDNKKTSKYYFFLSFILWIKTCMLERTHKYLKYLIPNQRMYVPPSNTNSSE